MACDISPVAMFSICGRFRSKVIWYSRLSKFLVHGSESSWYQRQTTLSPAVIQNQNVLLFTFEKYTFKNTLFLKEYTLWNARQWIILIGQTALSPTVLDNQRSHRGEQCFMIGEQKGKYQTFPRISNPKRKISNLSKNIIFYLRLLKQRITLSFLTNFVRSNLFDFWPHSKLPENASFYANRSWKYLTSWCLRVTWGNSCNELCFLAEMITWSVEVL